MDRATLFNILADKPEMTDYVAAYIVKYRLKYWKGVQEARVQYAKDDNPIESGYWEEIMDVLSDDGVAHSHKPMEFNEYYIPRYDNQ